MFGTDNKRINIGARAEDTQSKAAEREDLTAS